MLKEVLVLKAVGDIMLGDHPVCYGHGVRSTIEGMGFEFITAKLSDALDGADVLFGNLEAVLSNEGSDGKSLASMELRGRPEEALNLAKMGFTHINVANNHALQHGKAAFEETVETLRDNKIGIVGLTDGKRCNAVRIGNGNLEIIFLGYSQRPDKYCPSDALPYAFADESVILDHVKELRSRYSLPIVLSLHWGEEYLNYPSRRQIDFGHALADAGVCLILGHHSHVLQGVEQYKNAVIVYSLGNFIFDKWQRNPRESMVFRAAIGAAGVIETEIIPILISRAFQPMKACGRDADSIFAKLDKYSRTVVELGAGKDRFGGDGNRYRDAAKKAYLVFRIQSYLYFVRNIYKYDIRVIIDSGIRFVRRRLGIQ